MDVGRDAKYQIVDLADHLHEFGHRTEAHKIKLQGSDARHVEDS